MNAESSVARAARACKVKCLHGLAARATMILAGILAPCAAVAQTEQSLPTPAPIEFSEETLDNGLRVIYAPLHNAPVVHVRVLYHVGSRDERPDRNGFAHMFEHMMFRGSAHVAPEEHMKRIGTVGGYSNAFTSFDQTAYINTIPSQYLDMALWLEADRMASFKVSDEIYQTERKVVAEEWRMRHNQPYGNAFELFLATAFKKHPYRWTPIGDMDHLKAARVNELQEFFNDYYLPNNAVLVIAGDFEKPEASRLVKKYFGWIPQGDKPPRDIPAEPEQSEPRQSTVNEPVPLPMIMIGYHIPAYASDDMYALAALDAILGSGDSSRLQRLLVNSESPLCVNAGSMLLQLQDPGLFGVNAVVMQGKSVEEVREALNAAVADVVENGVTDEELLKAQTILLTSIVNGRKTADDLASQLGEEALFADDAGRVNEAPDKIKALTPSDIQRVAEKYLKPERSNTLTINPSMTAALASKAEAQKAEALKDAPVAPATAPVEARVVEFPENYPTTAPTAQPREAPEFAKGEETEINGVRVIVMPDHRLPLVRWSLTMRRGSQSDPKGKEGTAWLTCEMLRRGIEGMSFEELSRDLDSRAISITVGDGGDVIGLNGASTTDQLAHGIQRSRQILRTPTFPAEEFAKLKEQSINSLRVDQQRPTTAANNALTTALYGDTPLGRYATPQTVETITLDDVKRFYETYFHPNDAILILAGDVTVERGRELATELLNDWSSAPLPPVEFELPDKPETRKILLIDRPDAKQASVRAGIRAYTVQSDDKFPGSLASRILSSGIDSRLGKYVRATKGLAYGVHGTFNPGRTGGSFIASTETAVESTTDTIEAIFHVLDEMKAEPVTAEELADAQMRVAGGMVMSMQTIEDQARYRVEGILNGYPIDYYDRYAERIGAVSAEEIQDVMQQYVLDDQMTLVVVAPAAAVKESLEKLGEVEIIPMPGAEPATAPAPVPATKKAA